MAESSCPGQLGLPLNEPFDADGRRAVALYAIMDRDFCDFLDMIAEPDTSTRALRLLLKMLQNEERPRGTTDVELNRLGVEPVQRELERRERDE